MGQKLKRVFAVAIVAGLLTGFPVIAAAGKLDISLNGFIDCVGSDCTPQLREYETFLAEYLFGISPPKLSPAETLGYSGFYIGVEGSLTPRPLGREAEERWLRGNPSDEVQRVVWNPGIHIRKGLPFSFELGSRVSFLILSELVTLGGEVKWSLFEGFRTGWKGYLPDLAVRGQIARVLGQSDVDITLAGLDASLSYAFGLGGTIVLTPYLGYQFMWSVVHTEPLVYKDSAGSFFPQVGESEFVVTSLGNPLLGRHNLFFGMRLGFEYLALTAELDWGLPRSWDVDGADLVAKVGHQVRISSGLGADF